MQHPSAKVRMSTTPDLLTPHGSTTMGVFADAAGSPTPVQITTGEGSELHLGVGGVLRVLVACEYSGAVRDAFRALGHDAMSCDLLPTDAPGPHHTGDVMPLLEQSWDIVIAFPPCTYLCSSGMHWTVRGKRDPQLTEDALLFVAGLLGADAPHIALENPVGAISTRIRKPDCVIHPWQFGHPESKTTCLWLKNLPVLAPTNIMQKPASGRWENQFADGQNNLWGKKDAWKLRSKTYQGIADAMAAQWSAFALSARTNSQGANAATNPGAQLTLNIMPTAPASVRIMPKTSALKLSKKMVPCGEYGVAADFTGGGGGSETSHRHSESGNQ
jgi:hypothetical protein